MGMLQVPLRVEEGLEKKGLKEGRTAVHLLDEEMESSFLWLRRVEEAEVDLSSVCWEWSRLSVDQIARTRKTLMRCRSRCTGDACRVTAVDEKLERSCNCCWSRRAVGVKLKMLLSQRATGDAAATAVEVDELLLMASGCC